MLVTFCDVYHSFNVVRIAILLRSIKDAVFCQAIRATVERSFHITSKDSEKSLC